ncbi:MAG: NADH-quinone oxidoreductase subunit NuoE [Candidatus Zixiibacteriota bacterium]
MSAPQVIDYGIVDHPEPVAWSDEGRRKVEAIIAKYPDKQSATLPVLWLAVEEFGWISPQVEQIVADILDRPVNHIHEVVTFYTMFPRRPMGRHHIQICRNIACWIHGETRLVNHLKQRLGIEAGQVTPDGRFSLEEVECLAYCECAPALRMDNRYEGNLTIEKIDQLIDNAD